jgi:hypothetical protein
MIDEELLAIHQRLDRLDAKLDQIVTALTSQVAICGPEREKLDTICHAVYGNGRDGLVTRLARLETARRVWGNVVAALLGLLSGVGVTLLAWLLGKSP